MADELEDTLLDRLRALDARRDRLETELAAVLDPLEGSITEMAELLRKIAEINRERRAASERARALQPPRSAAPATAQVREQGTAGSQTPT